MIGGATAAGTPELVTFAVSHYCEKARWALDWHGIRYVETCWPPGLHLWLARRAGAPRGSLPILRSQGGLLQGSTAILDWAESHGDGRGASLAVVGDSTEANEIETRVNERTAVQVRRHVYANTLEEHPEAVRPALFARTRLPLRLAGNLMWPVTRRRIAAAYDAHPTTAADSRARLERELDWLDRKLADGREFLVGDRFSRVDLTVASLLAALSRPVQMPIYRDMRLPSALDEELARWSERPILQWVNALYARYRGDAATR
jgi:glutathione S-transferase